MKRIPVLFALMLLTVGAQAGMIVAKLNLDGQGVIDGTNGFGSTVSPGVGIAAEYLGNVHNVEKLMFGFGLEYQFPRAVTNAGYCGFMPLYLTGQYAMFSRGNYKPALKANLGYNLVFNGDRDFKLDNSAVMSGGVYYAVGIGSNISRDIAVEFMYSTYVGDWSSVTAANGTLIAQDTYSALGLRIGYCFDLGNKQAPRS